MQIDQGGKGERQSRFFQHQLLILEVKRGGITPSGEGKKGNKNEFFVLAMKMKKGKRRHST